jgi:hypothetical protein
VFKVKVMDLVPKWMLSEGFTINVVCWLQNKCHVLMEMSECNLDYKTRISLIRVAQRKLDGPQ